MSKEEIKITDEKEIKIILKAIKEINKRMKEIVDYSSSLEDEDSKAKKRIKYYIIELTRAYSVKRTYIPYCTEFKLKDNTFNKKELALLDDILERYGLTYLQINDSEELFQFLKNHAKTVNSIVIDKNRLSLYDNLLEYRFNRVYDIIEDNLKREEDDMILEYELSSEELEEFLNKNKIFTFYLNLDTGNLEYNKPDTDEFLHLTIMLNRIIGTPTIKESVESTVTIRVYEYNLDQHIYQFEIEANNKKNISKSFYFSIEQ